MFVRPGPLCLREEPPDPWPDDDLETDVVEEVVRAYSAAVKAYAARASGPKVHEALASNLRDQWIVAMADEIIDTMLNSTMTLW